MSFAEEEPFDLMEMVDEKAKFCMSYKGIQDERKHIIITILNAIGCAMANGVNQRDIWDALNKLTQKDETKL